MPLDWWERRENNEAVLEQSAIPPPYALLWEVRLRKPCALCQLEFPFGFKVMEVGAILQRPCLRTVPGSPAASRPADRKKGFLAQFLSKRNLSFKISLKFKCNLFKIYFPQDSFSTALPMISSHSRSYFRFVCCSQWFSRL